MKPIQKQRRLRADAQRWARERRRRAHRRELSRLGLSYRDMPRRAPNESGRIVFVTSPSRLSLATEEDCTAALNFLAEVRHAAATTNHRVIMNLRPCEHISPEIVLLLAAEFSRVKYFYGRGRITGVSPADENARTMLYAMGFFGALGLRDRSDKERPPVHFKIESGIGLDGGVSRRIATEFATALGLDAESDDAVHVALNEALENATEHAYLDPDQLPFAAESGRWWICSATFPGSAYLVVCDLGMTIPKTVPMIAEKRGPINVQVLNDILSLVGGPTREERLLAAAFEERVTRRPDGRGGRGLGKMARLLQDFGNGGLSIWSGGAAAFMMHGAPIATQRLTTAFPGTYVLWHLSKGEANDGD